jgi:hypothetical protein
MFDGPVKRTSTINALTMTRDILIWLAGKIMQLRVIQNFQQYCFTLFEHTFPLYHHQILLTTVILLYFACSFFININKKNYIFKQENLIFREE